MNDLLFVFALVTTFYLIFHFVVYKQPPAKRPELINKLFVVIALITVLLFVLRDRVDRNGLFGLTAILSVIIIVAYAFGKRMKIK